MHQSRRTHNAHNETQRRLKKALCRGWQRNIPHYTYIMYFKDGRVWWIEPYWVIPHYSGAIHQKCCYGRGIWPNSMEEVEAIRKHNWLANNSSSKKELKKYCNRTFRRKKIYYEVNNVNKKVLNSACEIHW